MVLPSFKGIRRFIDRNKVRMDCATTTHIPPAVPVAIAVEFGSATLSRRTYHLNLHQNRQLANALEGTGQGTGHVPIEGVCRYASQPVVAEFEAILEGPQRDLD